MIVLFTDFGLHGPYTVQMKAVLHHFVTLVEERAGSLLVSGDSFLVSKRDQLVALAARHAVPALYADLTFVTDGGLIAYGPDRADQFRGAATYVDRILKGEKPADLPVQAPTKYELVINLKTAKGLGLDVPATLLARADKVIE